MVALVMILIIKIIIRKKRMRKRKQRRSGGGRKGKWKYRDVELRNISGPYTFGYTYYTGCFLYFFYV